MRFFNPKPFLFFLLLMVAVAIAVPVRGQSSYWVVFPDKPIALRAAALLSPAALESRQQRQIPLVSPQDYPVSTAYLDSLKNRKLKVMAVSKWLNAAAVTLTPVQAQALKYASFVQSLHQINGYFTAARTSTSPNSKNRSKAIAQLQPEALFAAGLTGKGVKIGVIDVGFQGADQHPALATLFAQNNLPAYRDFVNPSQKNPYNLRESRLDDHGTEVLLRLAGDGPDQHARTGLATQATYYLARTEHGKTESRLEEAHFVRALEWMDSLGVRLINTSLGYGTDFDDPSENYQPHQMDGSSMIAQAVQLAVEEKGMTILVSAGNDGAKRSWQFLNTPADAAGALAIGSTNAPTWTRQSFSGIGPAFLPYLKPDLACFSAEGTSFSAPVIAGLAACLLEFNPSLTNAKLSQVLRHSGHLYPYGNNYVGYGVPNAGRALAFLQDSLDIISAKPPAPLLAITGNTFCYRVTQNRAELKQNGGIVIYRKKSATQVIRQEKRRLGTRVIHLKRLPGETHTTLQIGPEVMELVWQ